MLCSGERRTWLWAGHERKVLLPGTCENTSFSGTRADLENEQYKHGEHTYVSAAI